MEDPDLKLSISLILQISLVICLALGDRSRSASRTAPRRGADLQYQVAISFKEAVFGADKEIEIVQDEKCEYLLWKMAQNLEHLRKHALNVRVGERSGKPGKPF